MTETNTRGASHGPAGASKQVKVWDPLIRVFHWGLVAAFATAYLAAEGWQSVHEIAGYVVAGLLAFRLLWGLVGGRYARFTQFLKGPRATLDYLGAMKSGTERRYIGHNPAGAAMIVALVLTISGTALTGWLMEDTQRLAMLPSMPQVVTPAYADNDYDEGQYGEGDAGILGEVHEVLANIAVFLIVLHIAGVVLASVRHKENLANAMVTGKKRAPGPDDIA